MKSKKVAAAFNLIELMVVIGIAAVIFVLGIAGLMLAQRQSRDSERRSILAEISAEINEYRIINLIVPETSQVEFTDDGVYIGGVKKINLTGYRSSGSSSSRSETNYYYSRSGGGFILCAELESGSITSAGTVDCPATLP